MGKNYQTDNKSFVVYKDWEELLSALENDEQAGQLFKALFAFAKRGEEAEFVGALKIAFIVMRNAIERDGEKWEEVCGKRYECGKKGGRPPKTKEASSTENQKVIEETKRFLEKPKKPDNVNVKDNVNDIDNDNVSVSDNVQLSETYGQHKHVKLTQEEYNSLVSDYGKNIISDYISRIDEYIETNGIKPYNNHYRTVVDWLTKDKVSKQKTHSYDLGKLVDAFGDPIPL